MKLDINNRKNVVVRLRKALPGLKQAAATWHKTFTDSVKQIGWTPAKEAACLFYKHGNNAKNRKDFMSTIWVDDILSIGTTDELDDAEQDLNAIFNVKRVGTSNKHNLLGMTLEKTTDGILIGQEAYIDKVLTAFAMQDCKGVKTPISAGIKLQKAESKDDPQLLNDDDKQRYQSIVGSIQYAAIISRPDLSFTAGVLGRHSAAPTKQHMTAAKHALRYLKTTKTHRLMLKRGNNNKIEVYADADFAGDTDTSRSTTGYIIYVNGCPISWKSQRQPLVTRSTADAEYTASSFAAVDGIWIKRVINEVMGMDINTSIKLYNDNTTALKIMRTNAHTPKGRNVGVHYRWLREAIYDTKEIDAKYCSTDVMVADILTKPLSIDRIDELKDLIGFQR